MVPHPAGNRAREVSLRLALFAGRMRLVRAAVTANLMLSFLGGAAGLGQRHVDCPLP